jgi:hypothetical protein
MTQTTRKTSKPRHIDGWHFASTTLRDGSPLPKKGVTLTHKGKVMPCESGYHASVRAIDALRYAPGPFLARVRLSGTVKEHGSPIDKYAASKRETLTEYVDVSDTLHRFACAVATTALDLVESGGGKVDVRSRRAIAVKLLWLEKKATNNELDAAMDAAWAAWAAAWAAARAAGDAAWDAQNTLFESMLTEALQ